MTSSLKREINDLERKYFLNQQTNSNYENGKRSILQLKPFNQAEHDKYKRTLIGKTSNGDLRIRMELQERAMRSRSALKPAIKPTFSVSENQTIDWLSGKSSHNLRLQPGYNVRSLEQSKWVAGGLRERINLQTQPSQYETSDRLTPLKECKLFQNTADHLGRTSDRFTERKSFTSCKPRASVDEKSQRSTSTGRFSRKSPGDFLDKDLQELADTQKQKKRDLQESYSKLMAERERIMRDLEALEKKKSTISSQQPKLDKIIAIIDSGEISGANVNQIPDIDDLDFEEEERMTCQLFTAGSEF